MSALALQADLGIEHVTELYTELLSHLDDEDTLVLAGDKVQRVHTAGLQLLHAFVCDRAARGCATTVAMASSILAQAAQQLAIASSLGIDGSGEHA